MRTTSGLVLDVYDDFTGGVLRELYPSFEDIPAQVKEAHVVSVEDGQRLPDDVYALVLVNNGEKLRKFACIDEGNTLLSLAYFQKTAHKLPVEAQKVAAENLKVACAWYGIPVPEELEKVAGLMGMVGGAVVNHIKKDPIGSAMTAFTLPSVVKGTASAIKNNVSQLGNGGMKMAEVSGTDLAPAQGPGTPGTAPKSLTVVNKTATIGKLVPGGKTPATMPATNGVVLQKSPEKAPQAKTMHPTVDVSNAEPPRRITEKKASSFALPSQGKYPLDSYSEVKQASAYFDTFAKHMSPPTRREYAVNLTKRASDLSIAVSDLARKYGGSDFAPEAEIKAAFDARRIEVADDSENLALLGDVEKVARFRMWKEASAAAPVSLTAAQVTSMLVEFDKLAGLDHLYDRTIPDPYYSIYGFEKDAEEADFSEVIGNETVTAADLTRLARIGAFTVKSTFGEEFQEEFLKDPVGIFKSMPLAQKKMMMRMANSTQPGAERTYL